MIDFIKKEKSIVISKPIHGNLNNIFKKQYIGYTEKEAKAKFKIDFEQEQNKYFINEK